MGSAAREEKIKAKWWNEVSQFEKKSFNHLNWLLDYNLWSSKYGWKYNCTRQEKKCSSQIILEWIEEDDITISNKEQENDEGPSGHKINSNNLK